MQHDFKDIHAERDCNKKGFMSYYDHLMGWTDCNRLDFLVLYNQVYNSEGWCMSGKPF